MPPGSVHTSNTIATSALMATCSLFVDRSTLSNIDCTCLVFGCLSGILLSPDLDVNGGYIGFHFLRRIWIIGPFLSWIWWLFWTPYRWLIPHRSFISHFPVISTLIREVILFVPVVIFIHLFHIPIEFAWRTALMFTFGLIISDIYHIYADWMSGELREGERTWK